MNLRINYSDLPKPPSNKLPLSPLFLTDNTVLIHSTELVNSLFLSERIVYQNGKTIIISDLEKKFWMALQHQARRLSLKAQGC